MPKIDPKLEAKEFGRRLVALLERHGQPRRGAGAYLSRKYKVSVVVANCWLNGQFKPEIPKARAIAEDHGESFEALYFGTDRQVEDDPDSRASIRADLKALECALGAFAALLSRHQPAEALELASLLERMPEAVRDHELIRSLKSVLVAPAADSRKPVERT